MQIIKDAKGLDTLSSGKVSATVTQMLSEMRAEGYHAIRRYSQKFDKWSPDSFVLNQTQINDIISQVPDEVLDDIRFAQAQIRGFALAQRATLRDLEIETLPGIVLGHKHVPVANVGCYVPGGRYPLVASAHMGIVTAKAAGVERVVACTPPLEGVVHPATVAAMSLAGADEICIIGGVQALATLAFGTSEIARVDMIVGPGNAFVSEAKRQLFGEVGIDLLAGPTEVLIIADDTADPKLVATDLIGQAEHGPDSPAVLVTTSRRVAEETLREIEHQLVYLPSALIAGSAWRDYGQVLLANNETEALAISDRFAAEHVQIMTADPGIFLSQLRNYGSLFLGPETTVAYGDKVIGTNHILPTRGAARYTGGLWVGKFLKTLTYQRCTEEGSLGIARVCARLCELEGLSGHKAQADIRVQRFGSAA